MKVIGVELSFFVLAAAKEQNLKQENKVKIKKSSCSYPHWRKFFSEKIAGKATFCLLSPSYRNVIVFRDMNLRGIIIATL